MMKLKPILLLAALIFSVNISFAAFPVKSEPAPVSQEVMANNLRDGIVTDAQMAPSYNNHNAAAPYAPYSNGRSQKEGGGWAIASLACGVTGLLVAGLPLGICAVIFGVLGMSQDRPLQGLAIAGLIIGIIDVVAVLIFLSAQ